MLNMFIHLMCICEKNIIKTNIYHKTNNKKNIMFQKNLSVSLSFLSYSLKITNDSTSIPSVRPLAPLVIGSITLE